MRNSHYSLGGTMGRKHLYEINEINGILKTEWNFELMEFWN